MGEQVPSEACVAQLSILLQEPVSESGIAMDRCGGAATGQLKNVAKVTLATRGSGNGYGMDERSNSARSSTMRRHNPIPEGSGQPPGGEAPASESGIASGRYGGAAAGQGVVMGKGSRCYNPEGQRARGPEGQRARGPEGQAGGVMSWVVSLVGCGGPAVSRCGHETRRHRVRGALFASVFASVLLAACGGGSGGNLTTSSEREPGPPGPGPLTATGGGDGQGSESENEQQQRKIIVNQEEEQQQEIVVNIQPDPEESESEEQEEESEEEEEQQKQLTIMEEEDFPYVPPEEKEYETSPQTGGGNSLARIGLPEPKEQDTYAVSRTRNGYIAGVRYSLKNAFNSDSLFNFKGKNRNVKASIIKQGTTSVDNAFNPSHADYNFAYKNIDRHKKIEVTYTRENGFVGASTYKKGSNDIEADVTLKATFFDSLTTKTAIIHGYIGDDNGITMGGTNFGQIRFSANDVSEDGQFIDSNQISFSNKNITVEKGFNELRGSFKNDGSTTNFPTQVVGELKMKRFYDQSPLRSNPNEYTNNLYSRGDNALAGVFVADKASEVTQSIAPIKIDAIEGTIGMFGYGLWASENFLDNRIVFLEQTTKFNPERTASDYTAHTYHETYTGIVKTRYKREDGFKGVYIYEGETGELTGDVDLTVTFGGFGVVFISGNILTDLEIGGYDLKGIAAQNGPIDPRGIDNNDGVGGIDIDADGVDDNATNARLSFGNYIDNTGTIDRPTVSYHGLVRKVKMVLSPDGIQAQGSTPETYPSQIAGEVEINQFKIKESDGDNNTIVGVFVADKQE